MTTAEQITLVNTETAVVDDVALEQIVLVEHEQLIQTITEVVETVGQELLLETVAGSAELLDLSAPFEILEVCVQGLPGIPGSSGGDALQRIAGEGLSALQAVYELGPKVFALDADDDVHIDLLLGVTTTAALPGALVAVNRVGVIDDAGWSWTPGRVFLGAAGALTQVRPSGGFDVLVGVATSPTRLVIDIQEPIDLE